LLVAHCSLLLAACAAGTSPGPAPVPQAAPGRSVWDGVFTAAQAARGLRLYADDCAACHAENMRGGPGAPGVAGPEFLFNWNGRTVDELFEFVQTTMPPGGGGGLTGTEVVDLLAAVFQANAFPPHADLELPANRAALAAIRIAREAPTEE
jgi:cytochrome c